MKGRRAVLLCVVVLFAAVSCSQTSSRGRRPSGPSDTSDIPATVLVTKVTDGDTVHVGLDGDDERVRLIGVGTPEVGWYGGRAECYGAEAGRYAQGRLTGVRVRLEYDVNHRDRYGRILAYVYVGPELFNLTLVRLGYARADPVPPDTRLASTFQRAEDDARASGRGLWSACPA